MIPFLVSFAQLKGHKSKRTSKMLAVSKLCLLFLKNNISFHQIFQHKCLHNYMHKLDNSLNSFCPWNLNFKKGTNRQFSLSYSHNVMGISLWPVNRIDKGLVHRQMNLMYWDKLKMDSFSTVVLFKCSHTKTVLMRNPPRW